MTIPAATEIPPRPFWARTGFLIACVAILICVRMPEIILKGRFWTEEGKVFFHNAWTLPPLQALFFSFAGYMNLSANAGTLAARWLMPLPLAPYMTIGLSLLVMLCPFLVLLTARDHWLQPPHVRLAAVALALFVPNSQEVWLQTLHCQFHLALCAGLILALEELPFAPVRWFRRTLLFLAPLCGPIALVLLPLFVARAWLDKSWPRLAQAISLGAGAAIQLAFFFNFFPDRHYQLDPVTFLNLITLRHLVVPFLGIHHYSQSISEAVRSRLASGHIPLKATLLPFLVFIPLAYLVWRQRRQSAALWFFVAFGVLATFSYYGALDGAKAMLILHAGARYVFAPQALLGFSILALAAARPQPFSLAAWGVVAWLLLLGAWEYAHPWSLMANGPAWSSQIAAWRANPNHRIDLWPEGWWVYLPPQPTAPTPKTPNTEP